ncbi:MAG: alpha/beta hydrolase [Pseudomonadota bacterium]
MDLVVIGRNPVPTGAHVGEIKTEDGVRLRYARWEASRQPERGTVCVFPGRNEFIEKYFETVGDLRRRGFAVAVLDWRGQGGSQRLLDNPRKGHVREFADYDKDVAQFARDVVLPSCPPPYIALGHSMGGHILLRQTIDPEPWFEFLVVLAPMLAINREMLRYPTSLVSSYADVAVQFGFADSYAFGHDDNSGQVTVFEGNPLTSDKERFERNALVAETAPDLTLGGPTVGWLGSALRSMRRLARPEFVRRARVPTLVVSATDDRIIDPAISERYADRLKSGVLITLPSARHEVLQERDSIRSRFWAAFDAYLDIEAMVA